LELFLPLVVDVSGFNSLHFFLAINKVVIGSYKVKGREEKLCNDLEVMKFEDFFY
jgi:hypothetical protein